MDETIARSMDEMLELGRELSHSIKDGDIICFSGELGAGKTTLIKGIISQLTGCDIDQVTSPTFTYLQEYNSLVHFDLYRLNDPEQFSGMGFDEYFSSDRICLIEWPQRIKDLIPNHKSVEIYHIDGGRKIHTTLRRNS